MLDLLPRGSSYVIFEVEVMKWLRRSAHGEKAS
jgi:hypothetical protein